MKVANFLLIGVVLIFVLTKYNYIDVPLDRDEGTYLYLGKCFMDGYIPYVDFYEIKPPGVFLVYGVFEKIFGGSLWSLHFGLGLLQLVTAAIIYLLSCRIFLSNKSGFWSASFFLILCLSPSLLCFGLNSEFFIIFFLVLSFYLLVKYENNSTSIPLMVSGISLAVAMSMRQQVLLFCIPYFVLTVWVFGRNTKLYFQKMRWVLLGGCVYALLLIAYVYLKGGFNDMVYWVYTRPFEYYLSSVGWAKGQNILLGLLNLLWAEKMLILLITLFSLGYFIFSKSILNKTKAVVLLWLFISILAVIPGFRFFPHYFVYIFPPLAIITGILGLENKSKVSLTSLLVIVGLFIHFITRADVYFLHPAITTYEKIYGQNPNIAVQKAIELIKEHKNESEEVFVFGSEPQIYYLISQNLKQKHNYIAFAFQPTSNVTHIQKEIIQYLSLTRPKYIIHVQNLYSILLNPKSPQDLYKFMFQIEKEMYEPIYFAKINSDNSLSIYYEKEAKNQSIFSSNYVAIYRLTSDL